MHDETEARALILETNPGIKLGRHTLIFKRTGRVFFDLPGRDADGTAYGSTDKASGRAYGRSRVAQHRAKHPTD